MRPIMIRKKQLLIAALSVLLAICIIIPLATIATAETVNVYTVDNPTFTMENVYDEKISKGWEPHGELESHIGDVYVMNTDAYAFWNEGDSLDFACQKAGFNEGEGGFISKSVMTLTMTIDSWDGEGNASIGIHVRNSLDAFDEGAFLCVRPGQIFMMYRDGYKSAVNRGPNQTIATTYPMELKMTVDYSKGIVSGYYKQGDNWVLVGNGKYKATPEVYVGIGLHSVQGEMLFSHAQCSGFSYQLDAPEGYVVNIGDGEGGGETTATEPPVNLPEDGYVVGDALLKETFTDGDLFPAEKDITASNPLWTVHTGTAQVAIDDAQTNRWLSLTPDNEFMMTAGDMNWTDYSTALRLKYDSHEVMTLEKNQLSVLVRHRSVVIGGNYDYGITLINDIKNHELVGQKLRLDFRCSQSNYVPSFTTLKEVYLAEDSMVQTDVWHDLRIDTFDDEIRVYFDDELVLEWTAEDRAGMSNTTVNDSTYPNLYGSVGIYSSEASAMVDNITVRKLEDPLGGDYDNMVGGIGGSFDEPIPDYIHNIYGRE